MSKSWFATCLIAGMALASASRAAELGGVKLPDREIVGGKCLALNGIGVRTKFMLKIYVGGLYVERPSTDAGALVALDAPKKMVLHFLYPVSESQAEETYREGFAQNAPDYYAAHRAEVDRFLAALEEVRKGDRMTVTYAPGRGSALGLRGRTLITMPGAEFMRALFSLWLGPKPPTPYLKVGLLQPVQAREPYPACARDCKDGPRDACGCCLPPPKRPPVTASAPASAAGSASAPVAASAADSAPQPEPAPRPDAGTAQLPVIPAASSALLLIATEDCTVSVDTDPPLVLGRDEVRKLPVLKGDHLIRARRKSDGASFRTLTKLGEAEQAAVELAFPDAGDSPASVK